MTPRDFCYFVMGSLELMQADRSPVASQESMKEIREHLQLVFDTDTDADKYPDACKGMGFCNWLDGLLSNAGDSLTEAQLVKIQARLSTAFRTEIDPTFANSAELQSIHDGTERRDGDVIRRGDDDNQPRRRPSGPPLLC